MNTAVLIASGPTLNVDDIGYVKGKAHVFAIKDNWQLAPWADELVSAEIRWWEFYWDQVKDLPARKWGSKRSAKKFGINRQNMNRRIPTSGHAALKIATKMKFNRVLLVGYTMGKFNGDNHYYMNRPYSPPANGMPDFKSWIMKLMDIVNDSDAEIINCTQGSFLPLPYRNVRSLL